MTNDLVKGIAEQCDIRLKYFSSLSGGDINHAYRLQSVQGDLFLKANSLTHGFEMLKAEANGLKAISASDYLQTPKILKIGQYKDYAYLLLSFHESENPRAIFWENFANGLAQLHQQSSTSFGWPRDNFIGSLIQRNTHSDNWPVFFASRRLQPQLELARKAEIISEQEAEQLQSFIEQMPNLLPNEAPSLLHGDLWSGNFICAAQQQPILIDPACYFGHREVDLAMSLLFGGFHECFYQTYQSIFPSLPGLKERIEIYQTYYLLVHLNIFGRSYWGQIHRIINKYMN